MLITICVILYVIIAAIFHYGMVQEWEEDEDESLQDVSPTFFNIGLVAASLVWPLLVISVVWKSIKGEKL